MFLFSAREKRKGGLIFCFQKFVTERNVVKRARISGTKIVNIVYYQQAKIKSDRPLLSRRITKEVENRAIKTKGAFYLTKNPEKGTKGAEVSWEGFHKIQELVNFKKANHSTLKSGKKAN